MTGPEHFQRAQQHAKDAAQWMSDAAEADYKRKPDEAARLKEWAGHAREMGALHATLALAASTALQAVLPLVGDDQQVTDWGQAIGATLDTNQGARIASALSVLDELLEWSFITPGGAAKLRDALGAKDGDR